MAKLFFTLSGEHESLPASELKAILETEGFAYTVIEKRDQLLRIEAEIACIDVVKKRAALTRLCVIELFECVAELPRIIKSAKTADFSGILGAGESFAVRIKRVRNYSPRIDVMELERTLGELVLIAAQGTKVNLTRPDKILIGILSDGIFFFGLRKEEISLKPFVERRPRRKPFFHPSAMQPKLARCMVNLAKAKEGDWMVDPFCGTGSMVLEGSLIGCNTVGLDIQRRMVRGTRGNLRHFDVNPVYLIVADVLQIPLAKADCVVTDPPYGTSSTTLKRTTRLLLEQLLTSTRSLLLKGQRVCTAAPKALEVGRLATSLGYKHLESHFVYVHRSLTREVVVLEKL